MTNIRPPQQGQGWASACTVAFELGLSERQLEQFYYVDRKGAKKRFFKHEAFAEKYGINIRWIWDGDLCGHPRDMRKKTDSCR